MNPVGVSAQAMDPVDRTSAIATLVIAPDGRYGERAAAVLGEIGSVTFALASPAEPDDVTWLLRKARPTVVVLDATGCEAAVARVVAALSESAPRLGVVVVCEHLTDAARELHALPKWGWKRDLRSAVQRAQIDGSPLARRSALWSADRRDLRGVGSGLGARR